MVDRGSETRLTFEQYVPVPVPVEADVGNKSLLIYERFLQEYGELLTQPRVEQWVQGGVFPGGSFLGKLSAGRHSESKEFS